MNSIDANSLDSIIENYAEKNSNVDWEINKDEEETSLDCSLCCKHDVKHNYVAEVEGQ